MTLHELENAIAKLSKAELEQFRVWFADFDSDAWDHKFEQDVQAGKLNALADRAMREHDLGNTEEL